MEPINLLTLANSCVLNRNDIDLKNIHKDINVYKGEINENKTLILEYLTSFNPTWFTTARIIDKVSAEIIEKINNSYDDGVFMWDQEDIHHLEKYDMPLSEEFVSYVLNKCCK